MAENVKLAIIATNLTLIASWLGWYFVDSQLELVGGLIRFAVCVALAGVVGGATFFLTKAK